MRLARAEDGHKRPESVLVLICTVDDVLLLRRRRPADFWQSVTGSLEWGETAAGAARREVAEETGIDAAGALEDLHVASRYRILPAWRGRYAADVDFNLEHVWRLRLPARCEVRLHADEHVAYRWLPAAQAAALTGSTTNADAIRRFARGAPE